MKTKKKPVERADNFEPFVLELTVETQEEAQALYAIFNLRKNHILLGGKSDCILDALDGFYTRGIISNNIHHKEFFYNAK